MTLLAVPCEGADVLALFDEAGEDLGEIAVGRHPVHATVVAGGVYVATMGERSVTVVEPDGGVARIETGVLGPAHIEATGERLSVPCTAGDAVAVIDPETASLEGRVPTGAEPHDVGVLDDVAIAGSRTDGVLTVFDPVTRRVEARLDVPEPESARLQGIDAARGDAGPPSVYVVDQGNERVLLVGREGVREYASVGPDPYDATVTDERVYVASRGGETVHEFVPDLSDAVVHQTAAGPAGVVVVTGNPWVYHRGSSVVRSLDGRTVSLPAPVLAATVLPDDRVLLSHYEDHAVSLVDVESGRVEWTVETPAFPFGSVAV